MATLLFARVTHLNSVDWQNLRWLVAAAMPTLQWRHTGLGALQAYVREGETDELRVHLWHPSLVVPGIADSGAVHDHRFRMESTVLDGALAHVEHVFESRPGGQWRIHDVVHARLAKETVGTHHLPGAEDPDSYDCRTASLRIRAGQRYEFPPRMFHMTAISEPTVTLVRKTCQEATPPARVAHPVDRPLVHAFERTLPPDAWRHLILEAAERLRR